MLDEAEWKSCKLVLKAGMPKQPTKLPEPS